MATLNIAHYAPCTEVEGPGKRFALWCQGCRRRCPGCCNPQMLDFTPAMTIAVEDMLALIADARKNKGIEGVSLIGGEPFLQAEPLAGLAAQCRSLGLTVMAFTGYLYEELHQSDLPGALELLSRLDLLIDGPYRREEPETERNWAGSTNQRFHYLTGAYERSIEKKSGIDGMDIAIDNRGRIIINGSPSFLAGFDLKGIIEGP